MSSRKPSIPKALLTPTLSDRCVTSWVVLSMETRGAVEPTPSPQPTIDANPHMSIVGLVLAEELPGRR
jgi:hypothetical protein